MNVNIDKLKIEFENVLSFWLHKGFSSNKEALNQELSIDGTPNANALSGSMFLSRIIYGASIACKTLKTEKYKVLADAAYSTLIADFKNPNGGYYWAKDTDGNIVHDAENVNMAQAFVIYGLSEYVSLNSDADKELIQQSKFVIQKITDIENGGFIDGFDEDWNPINNQTKALGTHVHLLEAFTKQFINNKQIKLIPVIDYLIQIIIGKFFVSETAEFLHRTTPDWKALPSENWAGHNAEVSWILCWSASAIKSEQLIEKSSNMALQIMDKVIDVAFDKNGGVYNVIENNKPTETVKGWWPQAEIAIGLVNAYQISGDKKYLDKAKELTDFISNNFVHASGEWYAELGNDNAATLNQPLVSFWKAMYHNVRYYIELMERL